MKPKCPTCDADLLVVTRSIEVSEVDGLETNDPLQPIPGSIIRTWNDDSFQSCYWCPSCNTNISFGGAVVA
jgi:hypothetical protein